MLELLKKSAMEQSKALKNKEMDEIQNIIQTIIDVDVDFDTPKSLGLSSIKKTFKQETIVSETTFHRGSLRSGQRLEVDGSVVILGDVNSGAEVMASDNIVILYFNNKVPAKYRANRKLRITFNYHICRCVISIDYENSRSK